MKRRFQHSYFSVKFAKILRTPILKNIFKRMLSATGFELTTSSLAEWLTVYLRTKWLWVRIPLQLRYRAYFE